MSPVAKAPVRRLAALVAVALLAACSTKEAPYVERPVEELYNLAVTSLEEGNYIQAAKDFDEVERQHPYSQWAVRAQLMAGYAHYENNAYDDAIVALDRFLQLHPSHKDADYAYYLKALCYYEQISDVARDQKMTELAMKSLNEVVSRFPHSRYARDAQIKLDLTRDHLAGKEMDIGRYYLQQKQYLAAINRFKAVIDNYQTTTHVPEALHRLAEAYLALGITDEARKAAAVLGHNFPGSDWYIDSYELVEDKPVRPKEEKPWYKIW
jgi:outer membrane protein assembly factor BamD